MRFNSSARQQYLFVQLQTKNSAQLIAIINQYSPVAVKHKYLTKPLNVKAL